MDPIGLITQITGGVLRRIADAIDAQPPTEQGITIRIDAVHVHTFDPPTPPPTTSVRDRFRKRS